MMVIVYEYYLPYGDNCLAFRYSQVLLSFKAFVICNRDNTSYGKKHNTKGPMPTKDKDVRIQFSFEMSQYSLINSKHLFRKRIKFGR